MRSVFRLLICVSLVALSSAPVDAKLGGEVGDTAPDFPKGEFSDGGQYHISDYAGKEVVVLFFYERQCPTCRRTIPGRNKVVRQFAGKPVKFFAIGAGDSIDEVKAYVNDTHLAMPAFADKRSLMEKSYGIHISLRNIYQVRVVGADGVIVGYDMDVAAIDNAMKQMELAKTGTNASEPMQTQPTSQIMESSQNNTAGGEGEKAEAALSIPESAIALSKRSVEEPKLRELPEDEQKDPNAEKREQAANLNNDAIAAMREGKNSLAVEKLKESIKIDPTYKLARQNLQAAYTNYGIELINSGKIEEAEKAMKQSFDMAKELYTAADAKFIDAKDNYAGVLRRLGRKDEADKLMAETMGN